MGDVEQPGMLARPVVLGEDAGRDIAPAWRSRRRAPCGRRAATCSAWSGVFRSGSSACGWLGHGVPSTMDRASIGPCGPLSAPPLSEDLRDFPRRYQRRLRPSVGDARRNVAAFQSASSRAVLLPERFRGGCAFGAGSSCDAPVSPAGIRAALVWPRPRTMSTPRRSPRASASAALALCRALGLRAAGAGTSPTSISYSRGLCRHDEAVLHRDEARLGVACRDRDRDARVRVARTLSPRLTTKAPARRSARRRRPARAAPGPRRRPSRESSRRAARRIRGRTGRARSGCGAPPRRRRGRPFRPGWRRRPRSRRRSGNRRPRPGAAPGGTVVPPNMKRLLSVSPIPRAAAGPASASPQRQRRPSASAVGACRKRSSVLPRLRAARSLRRLRQGVEPGAEAVQRDRNADAFLRRLEHDEGGGLAGLHLVDQSCPPSRPRRRSRSPGSARSRRGRYRSGRS